ncbi:MAG: hypothetical protein ABEI27_05050 [Halobellus sp.]|uniref:hypothetical protein n=1 Tax=Halobellus sp. TaxID=1979212 RepID=UPI0035D43903
MASRSDPTPAPDAPAESVASTLQSAGFVRLLPGADGDALAAAGLLARALRCVDVPFQVRVDPLGADAPATDEGVLVAISAERSGADVTFAPTVGSAATCRAYEVASKVAGEDPDPVLSLAGVVAAGAHPGSVAETMLDRAEASESVDRRPGVAIPTADVADGLAHSTLFHAPVSGDPDAVDEAIGSLVAAGEAGEAIGTELASFVALAVAGDSEATARGAEAVERALRPYATPGGPTATVGGFADVLNAAARERPGTAVALALGHGATDAALDAWRTHARIVHQALRASHTGRYDGVFAVRSDVGTDEDARVAGRLGTLARLARDFRSPEPFVVALGEGVAALSAVESGASDAAETIASEFVAGDRAAWTGTPTEAVVRFDPVAADADVIAAIREAIR